MLKQHPQLQARQACIGQQGLERRHDRVAQQHDDILDGRVLSLRFEHGMPDHILVQALGPAQLRRPIQDQDPLLGRQTLDQRILSRDEDGVRLRSEFGRPNGI